MYIYIYIYGPLEYSKANNQAFVLLLSPNNLKREIKDQL